METHFKRKVRAVRAEVLHAFRHGLITRPTECELCKKSGKPEGHHEDYDKPLDLAWVCRRCHVFLHCVARGLIQDEINAYAQTVQETEEIPLFRDIPGLLVILSWKDEENGGVVYIARRNARRDHYRRGITHLERLISSRPGERNRLNTNRRNALHVADARLERLRAIYGDLPESELLARASQEVA